MLSITRMFVMYSKGSASADRIQGGARGPDDLVAESVRHTNDEYHITFENVTFSYHKSKSSAVCFDNGRDKRKTPLEDISFALRKGETLGIIGAIGSGKSTIRVCS